MCGARYKTRPGLTYHYTHSHKEGKCAAVTGEEETSSEANAPPPTPPPPPQDTSAGWQTPHFQDSYLTFLNTPGTLSSCLLYLFCSTFFCLLLVCFELEVVTYDFCHCLSITNFFYIVFHLFDSLFFRLI